MYERLFKPVDNAALVLFRMFLGVLIFAESFGAIATGWVHTNLIAPGFTFSYIGLEWLQPLPGNGMYVYFALMGLLGLAVMAGYYYRFSLGLFTLLWAGAYLMQKSAYNNHYYLLLLTCVMMLFLPAAADKSIDARRTGKRASRMAQWCSWVIIIQIAIVYFFAAVAKFYPGWLDGSFLRLALQKPGTIMDIQVFREQWFILALSWGGIFFDLFIIPMFLWKRTRTIALLASLLFHCFNAVVLQIGIFPFFALSFVVFFYPPETIRTVFFRKATVHDVRVPNRRRVFRWFFLPYLILQLALPLRHWFIDGDVLWTEEGQRLSWRMMLRMRDGRLHYRIVDTNGALLDYSLEDSLTSKQLAFLTSRPDGIWQMAQRIHNQFALQGKDVKVYADCRASINGGPYSVLIDPEADLAKAGWSHFRHNPWILPRHAER